MTIETADTPTETTAERTIETPLDLDNDTQVAFLRWCAQDFRADIAKPADESEYADGDELTDEERAAAERFAAGLDEAADALAADPDSAIGLVVLCFVFDDAWGEYQDHLANIADAEIVDDASTSEGEAQQ